MSCAARGCPRSLNHAGEFCPWHWRSLPSAIMRALRCQPSPERDRALTAAIGCIAMREDRPVTAAERSAINRFVTHT